MNNNQITNTLQCQTIAYDKQNACSRQFKDLQFIARGSEGIVYLATPINTDYNVDQVAVKIQKQKNEIMQFYQKLKEQQITLNQQGSNEKSYIIKIFDLCQDDNQNLVIIMEVGRQDLYQYINQYKDLNIKRKEQICLQLAQAIKQLHQLNYIHRDIKPENFVNVNNEFKLIDFGLTRPLEFEKEMTLKVGSGVFQSPEIIVGDGHYTSSVDIWSLGCTFYEVLTNDQLIKAKNLPELQKLIQNHLNDQSYIYDLIKNSKISEKWKTLIKQMLHHKPDQRVDTQEIVSRIQSFINCSNIKIPDHEQINRLYTPQSNNPNIQQGINNFKPSPPQANGVSQQNHTAPSFQPCIINNNPQVQKKLITLNLNQNEQKVVFYTQEKKDIIFQQQINTNVQQFPKQQQDQLVNQQQMNQKIQQLETDLCQAREKIKNLESENNKLKNQNENMIVFLKEQKNNQQKSLEAINNILLNQNQQE